MNIFEKLNMLLTESEGGSKAKESDIPIHPEMETKEQGEMAAAEKILKLFQKLKANFGSSEEEIKDSKPEIPDDIIDPMMKERPKSSKDKSFEKNKLAGWDEESEEKVKKEVDVDSGDGEDDEYDDFDYRRNPFGDEDDDDDDTSEYDDDERSEDEKLRDSIDNAIDSLGDGDEDEGEDDEFIEEDDDDDKPSKKKKIKVIRKNKGDGFDYTWLIIGGGVAVLLIAAGIILFVILKKKKNKEEE